MDRPCTCSYANGIQRNGAIALRGAVGSADVQRRSIHHGWKEDGGIRYLPKRHAGGGDSRSANEGGVQQRRHFVLLPDNNSTKDFAHEKNTKAPEGTATGATAGGVIGGTLGLLAGIGTLAIPGFGPFIAAGPIMGTLAGLGAGGAVGGLIGALAGMGIPEYEAKRYEGRIKDGGILLSVHCDTSEEITRAKHVLEQSGAQDISSTGEASADNPNAAPKRY